MTEQWLQPSMSIETNGAIIGERIHTSEATEVKVSWSNNALIFSGVFVAAVGPGGHAADYPSKPVRLVVPYPPGGPADTLARMLVPGVSGVLGAPVVVDNRGGAGGSIGVDMVVKAPSDGYSLLFGNDGPVAVTPSLNKRVTYSATRDLSAITQLTSSQLILVSSPSAPFRTLKALIDAARASPSKFTFASSGNGNASHLAGELLKTMTGINLIHVPYKGAAPALTDVMGGQVHLLFNNLLSAVPQVKAGKLGAIATTGSKRTVATPETPTISESGIAGYDVALWAGILVPVGTPNPVQNAIHKAFSDAIRQNDVTSRLTAQGVEVVASTPSQFSRHIAEEVSKWAKVISASGARLD